ncbi:glycoside hydrolase family 32 protein [Paenibacillus sp. WLX1005]|uniref:glycoside hydrolase family 32 protein n=1 Tax=Paenibacillus sp. WLX1005 TaxID=3243766 RepID=UPI003983E371
METSDLQVYKPRLHFAPTHHRVHDISGLVDMGGEYHLFYRYEQDHAVQQNIRWGHAVSTDLIQWQELDMQMQWDERGWAQSGCVVVDTSNTSGLFPDGPGMVAIHTSQQPTTSQQPITDTPDAADQTIPSWNIGIAYSHDGGRTWMPYAGNPVLTDLENGTVCQDPRVFWYRPKGCWIMVLATGQDVCFYSSSNLLNWQRTSRFGSKHGSHEGQWRYPDLFRLNIEGTESCKWVLLISMADEPALGNGSRTQYFVGSFDGRQFMPDDNRIQWLDYGRDHYGSISLTDHTQRDPKRIQIGWMNNWRYADELPVANWNGAMTLPRTLTLRPYKNRMLICQRPVAELERHFHEKYKLNGCTITEQQPYELIQPLNIADIQLRMQHDGLQEMGIIIHHTAEQYTVISYNAANELFSVKRDHSSSSDLEPHPLFQRGQQVHIPPSSHLSLRIVLDRCSIEAFAGDGMYAITSLIFPDRTCEKITMYTVGGDVRLYDSWILVG